MFFKKSGVYKNIFPDLENISSQLSTAKSLKHH